MPIQNEQEGNKLIAEFEGWKFARDDNGEMVGFFKDDKRWVVSTKEFEDILSMGFDYPLNWNSLMRIVEKIESMTAIDGRGEVNFVVTIEPGYCVISQGGEGVISEAQEWDLGLTKIQVVYEAVIGFINWYNVNKNEPHE